MIRFTHPFGAILRMFSALRATSSFRWDDDHEVYGHQDRKPVMRDIRTEAVGLRCA